VALMHQFLTEKAEWYEACLARRDDALGRPHIKPTLVPLLKILERDRPSRMAVLALRMGVTRRRIGQIAAEGVQAGVLEFVSDPNDARVALLRHSALGLVMVDRAIESMRLIEAELERRIGRKNLESLIDLLRMDWGPVFASEESGKKETSARSIGTAKNSLKKQTP
jgi:DNA-binding MarR family transcriptional regulator